MPTTSAPEARPVGDVALAEYPSWGRFPRVWHRSVLPIRWRTQLPDLAALEGPLLPRGYGRSYGDSCLNDGGVLLDMRPLRRFIDFDRERGTLSCEAGATLADVLELIVPAGWFLPVVPGTQTVSVGGAIANDIHGKNHHREGSFGCHVESFELLRSSGEILICSPTRNAQLFAATIGGLGLTGIILSARLRLKRIDTPNIAAERIRFSGLDEFFAISAASDRTHEYTVAWVDCLSPQTSVGRGVFFRGNHDSGEGELRAHPRRSARLRMPFDLPGGMLNPVGLRAFNAAYYWLPPTRHRSYVADYSRFFFPLDGIRDWQRLYGQRGFLQYQCVVPPENGPEVIHEILVRVRRSREASFLAVLKNFGPARSPGLLSFPRTGPTLAMDFPFRQGVTLPLLDTLDEIVASVGGAVYPAKDARMTQASFRAFFPEAEEFVNFIDPAFSSTFWRRVTGGTYR